MQFEICIGTGENLHDMALRIRVAKLEHILPRGEKCFLDLDWLVHRENCFFVPFIRSSLQRQDSSDERDAA
jgi:hypothetical protein